jgi:hypothetical protein
LYPLSSNQATTFLGANGAQLARTARALLVQHAVKVLLGLPCLPEHAVEEPARTNLGVPVRDRNPPRDAASVVILYPYLVIATPRQLEAVTAEHGPELIEPWRHAARRN